MIYPGGWNDLEISAPRPIKPIIALMSVSDGGTYNGEIVNSTTYFSPTGGVWASNPFTFATEPKVVGVNAGLQQDEGFKAEAMNQQTKMANITNAPPPLSNLLFLYGNKNGILKYQMILEIDLGVAFYSYLELSILENAATDGGPNGVVQAYYTEKVGGFTGVVTLNMFFDNFFGPINLGLRAESTTGDSSIMPLYCNILDADIR